jgi:hypothetical protein
VFYCIFMTTFLKSFEGVHEETPPTHPPPVCIYARNERKTGFKTFVALILV